MDTNYTQLAAISHHYLAAGDAPPGQAGRGNADHLTAGSPRACPPFPFPAAYRAGAPYKGKNRGSSSEYRPSINSVSGTPARTKSENR